MGVVDVQQRAVTAGDLGERLQVGGVAGHAVDAVHAHEPRAVGLGAQQLVEVVRILEAEAPDRGAARARHLAAVVDRLVCARVEEDRAGGGQQRDHRHVDVRDRRQDERVLAAEQRGQPLLDLLVEHRAAEQPRPARVRAPRVEIGRDRVDDLAVEVEAEVVAGGEVRQPLVADPDHAAVDLVDDGVHHRVCRPQLGQVAARLEPVLEPRLARSASGRITREVQGADRRVHRQDIGGTPGALELGVSTASDFGARVKHPRVWPDSTGEMNEDSTTSTWAAVADRARTLGRRPWVWYPAVALAVAVLYLAGPLGTGPVFNLLGASSALAVIAGARLWTPRGRFGWELIALGQVLFVAGDVLAYNYEALFGSQLPFPSIADPAYLAMYPCLVLGLMVLMRASDPTRDRGALIDAFVITIGVGTLAWVFLMAPYAHDGDLTLMTKVTSLAYPTMDLLLVAMGARVVLGGAHRGISASVLAIALVALLGTDAAYGWLLLHGGYDTGGLLDAGWIAFYVLIGTAALHPSMRRLSEPAPGRDSRLTRRRLALFAGASLVAPCVQLLRSLLDLPREPAISVAAGALFVLVLARLAGMVRVQEARIESTLRGRFDARLAALVQNASDVVSLVDATGRITYVSPSGTRLLGRPADAILGRRWEELIHPDDAPEARRLLAALMAGESAGIDHRLARSNGSWLDVETLATNLLGDDSVDAVVLNTRDVSQRKELERRLAHQAAHDALTGLPARALFEDRIEQALARRRRDGRRLAVLFVDLDDFKALNDTWGHAAGDIALREVAARLERSVRDSDSAARLGGDEFGVLLDGIDGPDEAEIAISHHTSRR